MNLQKTISVGALSAALLLTLSACTGGSEPKVEPSKDITLKLATSAQPLDQALGHIYGDALKTKGYTVELTEPTADPYQQVIGGQADLAIDRALNALDLVQAPATFTGEDKLLNAEETATLRDQLNEQYQELSALDLSAADAGKILVMSTAEAKVHNINSTESLAAACADLQIISDAASSATLKTALQDAGCADPKVAAEEPATLDDRLRTTLDAAVVLSAGDSVISDEGFYGIPDSANLFNAEPYMLLADQHVDDTARNELNRITGEFSQQALVDLNRMLNQSDALSPRQAADRWGWIANR